MKVFTQAIRDPDLGSVTLAATCRHCAEFLPSERTPSVGNCLLHATPVLAQDKVCSQYYPPEGYASMGSDDEF